MTAITYLLFCLGLLCGIFAAVCLIFPKIAFFVKNRTRLNGALSYATLAVILIFISVIFAPEEIRQKGAEIRQAQQEEKARLERELAEAEKAKKEQLAREEEEKKSALQAMSPTIEETNITRKETGDTKKEPLSFADSTPQSTQKETNTNQNAEDAVEIQTLLVMTPQVEEPVQKSAPIEKKTVKIIEPSPKPVVQAKKPVNTEKVAPTKKQTVAKSGAKVDRTHGQQLAAGAKFSGNVSTYKYHRPGCRYFYCRDCVRSFNSREEARASGFVPCQKCGG